MITPSEKTQRQYIEISEKLLKRYAEAHGIEQWSYLPLGVGAWLQETAIGERWSKKTLWLYRAALTFYLKGNGPVEAVGEVQKVSAHQCPRRGTRTSARKEKGITKETLKILCEHFLKTQAPIDKLLALWLVCGKIAGLRPCEWETAQMDGSILRVKNAKFNDIRATGEFRTLNFHDAPELVQLLSDFIKEINRWIPLQEGSFAKLYKKCRSRLRTVCIKLWPQRKKYPSLYSPRHQFAADLKSMGVERDILGALMGHASDETASIHYARRGKGEGGGVVPGANPLEVSKVRQVWSPPPTSLKEKQ